VNIAFRVPTYPTGDSPDPSFEWPEGWPPPNEGDEIVTGNGVGATVKRVLWYPAGEYGSEPFVYVVLK
jgi:hypothetical protein